MSHYIEYLGMESFWGRSACLIVMKAWLILMDMGTTLMLNREMGRCYTSGAQ